MKTPYIHTQSGVSVVLNGRPYNAAKDDAIYADVVRLLEDPRGTPDDLLEVFEGAARRLKEITGLTPDMLYSGGVIKYRGEALHNYAADKLVAMIENNRDHKPLARFLERLQANPSKRVVDNLYSFLEHGSIPLTDSGHFLAYKAVRRDFKDIHSGTFDNSVGRVCVMQRNQVDENPERTCSQGLHVCSFDYLPHFSHADGHVMVVMVDPADVVAIPADYNDTKMRVSKYQVVGEVEGYYANRVDVLADVGQSHGVAGMFVVEDDEGDEAGEFFTLEEAKRQAQAWFNDHDVVTYVVDDEGMVLWTVDSSGGY